MRRSTHGRARVRRVVVVVPSLFTLANLFFGIWAIILATQGDFYRAGWWIVIAGLLDTVDGLFARMSRTETKFGAELDSLVDIISFGVAPAILIYMAQFSSQGQFAWVFSYAFIVCVALRLARYNLQPDSEGRGTFVGLPSPAAGMTLATYFPFTQTSFYQTQLSGLPWPQILLFLTITLSLAMVSQVRYARLPRIGYRTSSGLMGLAVYLSILGFGIWSRDIFFFPLGIAYVAYGFVRTAAVGFLERGDDESGEPQESAGPSLVNETRNKRKSKDGTV